MGAAEFDRELLGVGDWPPEEEAWEIVTEEAWQACAMADPGGAVRPLAFAWDVAEDLACATIASAWDRPGDASTGKPGQIARAAGDRAEVLEIPRGCSREGTAWVIPRLVELRANGSLSPSALPTNGPGASLDR